MAVAAAGLTINRRAYATNDRVLLCLTTLHHRRFIEDAIHIVGLPPGARIRLRYRRPYVEEELWSQVASGQPVGDLQVLVTLAGSAADGTRHLLQPLRNGRVVRIRCEGSVMVIDVSLGGFVFEVGRGSSFESEMRVVAPSLPPNFRYRREARHTYLQALRSAPGSLLQSESVDAWERIAEGFFRVDGIGADPSNSEECGVPFLYFIQIPSKKLARRFLKAGAFDVEASRSLRLEIHTLAASTKAAIRDPIGEVLLDVSGGATSFTSSRRVRIDSRRDVRSVRLATAPVFRRAAGHLSVRTVVFCNAIPPRARGFPQTFMIAATDREEVVVARYDFPLKIGRVLPWLASGLVGAAAAFAALKIPDQGNIQATAYVMSGLAFAIAFVGVTLGLRGDSRR